VTLWATFAPCFVWILMGAPWVEALRGNARLRGALSLITAAVVGVIAQLSVWFALHTWFGQVERLRFGVVAVSLPELRTLQPAALALSALAVVLLFRLKVPMGWVLVACGGGGLLWRW
jgi:chromate transporter